MRLKLGLLILFYIAYRIQRFANLRASSTEGTAVRIHTPEHIKQAVVIGATGATGRQLVLQLLQSDSWSKVTTVSRRRLEEEWLPDDEKMLHKLNQIVVPALGPSDVGSAEAWKGADVLFNCIGTTRAQAGGAEGFVTIEVGITTAAADAAQQAGVGHVVVVSAQGANHRTWVPSTLIHPLLYARTLGQKEQAVLTRGFPRVTIFRPGMLDRLMGDRLLETLLNRLGLGLPVDRLAAAMVRDAESSPVAAASAAAGGEPGAAGVEAPVFYDGNGAITGSLQGLPPPGPLGQAATDADQAKADQLAADQATEHATADQATDQATDADL